MRGWGEGVRSVVEGEEVRSEGVEEGLREREKR